MNPMAISRPKASRSGPRPHRATDAAVAIPTPVALSPAEAWALYDARTRELLEVSADEFERRWEAGEYEGRQEEQSLRRVLMLRTARPAC